MIYAIIILYIFLVINFLMLWKVSKNQDVLDERLQDVEADIIYRETYLKK